MKIRNLQLEAFENEFDLRLCKALQAHMNEHFPEFKKTLNQLQISEFVKYVVLESRSYCFDTEYLIFNYFNIVLTLGPAFEKNPKYKLLALVMNDFSIEPEERMEELLSLAGVYIAEDGWVV